MKFIKQLLVDVGSTFRVYTAAAFALVLAGFVGGLITTLVL